MQLEKQPAPINNFKACQLFATSKARWKKLLAENYSEHATEVKIIKEIIAHGYVDLFSDWFLDQSLFSENLEFDNEIYRAHD